MKTRLLLGVCCSASLLGAEFVNLTFDEPDLSQLRNDSVKGTVGPAEDLLRGWEVSLRPVLGEWQPLHGEIEFAITANGQTPVSLVTGLHFDPADLGVWFYNVTPGLGQPRPPEARISTSGTVPERALTFDWINGTGVLVSITDGVSVVESIGGVGFLNVQQFAGKDVIISITGGGGFDVTGFTVVPEPERWALLGVGLGVVLWWSRRR